MISLDVEEMELLVGKPTGGVCFVPGIGSTLKEGVFVWKKVSILGVSSSVFRDSWSLEENRERASTG